MSGGCVHPVTLHLKRLKLSSQRRNSLQLEPVLTESVLRSLKIKQCTVGLKAVLFVTCYNEITSLVIQVLNSNLDQKEDQ